MMIYVRHLRMGASGRRAGQKCAIEVVWHGSTISQKQEQKDKADKRRKKRVGKEKNKKYVDDP